MIERHGLDGQEYINNKIIKISDKNDKIYLRYDADAETAELIKDIDQWIYDLSDSDFFELGIDVNKLYNGHVEATLEDIRKNPGITYHWTTEEVLELIQRDGQMVGSRGTGINNRGAFGIFTTVNIEEYSNGTYGDIQLELNLSQFMKESGLPELNLDFEPEIEEYLLREYVRSSLKIESRDDVPSDISPYTLIVNHKIPIKYIKNITK